MAHYFAVVKAHIVLLSNAEGPWVVYPNSDVDVMVDDAIVHKIFRCVKHEKRNMWRQSRAGRLRCRQGLSMLFVASSIMESIEPGEKQEAMPVKILNSYIG